MASGRMIRRYELKVGCPVDACSLVEVGGYCAEEAGEDEHLVRDAEGEVRQDDADPAVEQVEFEHHIEQGREGDLNGDHRAEGDDGEQGALADEPQPCQRERGQRRHDDAERHLDDRNEQTVLEASEQLPAVPRLAVVGDIE